MILSVGRDMFHQMRLVKGLSNPTFNTSNDGTSPASPGNLFHCLSALVI